MFIIWAATDEGHTGQMFTQYYIETRTSRLKGIVNRRRNVPDASIGTNLGPPKGNKIKS